MNEEVTSPNMLTSSLSNIVMAEPRFATLTKKDLDLLLDDKDAKSTKRATKPALKVFINILKKRRQVNLQRKKRLQMW